MQRKEHENLIVEGQATAILAGITKNQMVSFEVSKYSWRPPKSSPRVSCRRALKGLNTLRLGDPDISDVHE